MAVGAFPAIFSYRSCRCHRAPIDTAGSHVPPGGSTRVYLWNRNGDLMAANVGNARGSISFRLVHLIRETLHYMTCTHIPDWTGGNARPAVKFFDSAHSARRGGDRSGQRSTLPPTLRGCGLQTAYRTTRRAAESARHPGSRRHMPDDTCVWRQHEIDGVSRARAV